MTKTDLGGFAPIAVLWLTAGTVAVRQVDGYARQPWLLVLFVGAVGGILLLLVTLTVVELLGRIVGWLMRGGPWRPREGEEWEDPNVRAGALLALVLLGWGLESRAAREREWVTCMERALSGPTAQFRATTDGAVFAARWCVGVVRGDNDPEMKD